MLRSGTSIGANIREAQNAESAADFIHKLGVAQKETDETIYWIELLHRTEFLTYAEYQSIFQDTNELLRMIRSGRIPK
ncbi:MAG: four helix bundle protein [Lewinellaceae bacterium]|nr:four helix bundle protein [Lewinellaceae bacterium]